MELDYLPDGDLVIVTSRIPGRGNFHFDSEATICLRDLFGDLFPKEAGIYKVIFEKLRGNNVQLSIR